MNNTTQETAATLKALQERAKNGEFKHAGELMTACTSQGLGYGAFNIIDRYAAKNGFYTNN
jgi:hypothetical protein